MVLADAKGIRIFSLDTRQVRCQVHIGCGIRLPTIAPPQRGPLLLCLSGSVFIDICVSGSQVCYQIGVGAVSAAEMLFSTSLLAFVGSGESRSAIVDYQHS